MPHISLTVTNVNVSLVYANVGLESFRYVLRCDERLCDWMNFSFLKYLSTDLHNCCTSEHSHQYCIRIPIPDYLGMIYCYLFSL